MTAVGVVCDVPAGGAPPPREWWQVWAERRARWWERHSGLKRRLSVARTVGLWVGLCYLLVVAVAWPDLLFGMRAWVGACLGAVAWFFLARTKTLTWSGFMRFFAVCGLWSVVVALVLAMVSSALGNGGVEALGPTVFVAGVGEESLKLLPLVALGVAAPRRVSRFAAVDWWLLGLASGLAFEMVEEGARRVWLLAEMERQGLLEGYRELYGAGVPDGMVSFGLLPSDWAREGAAFAGHAVATGMVAGLVGLAVVVWRWGRGRGAVGWAGRVVAAVLPVVCLVTMMADHLVFNAQSDDLVVDGDGAWLDPQVSAVPWWLRVPWQVFGHGHYRAVWFVVLFVVCLLVDGYRLGSRPASSLGGLPMGPSLGGAVARLWVLPGRWGRAWAVVGTAVLATGWVIGRDLGQVAAAHVRGAGEPVRAAMRRGQVAASTVRALREVAMEHAAGPVRPARTRLLAVVVGAGLLVAALWVAPHLAAQTGEGLLRLDAGWLPGVLNALSEYWNSLPLAKQIAVELALGAMFALAMGPIGWGVAGVLTWGLAHGAGVATFIRDPRAAVEDYLANLTPAQAVADLLDVFFTFAPGNFATAGRAMARTTAHHATIDPVAVVNERRRAVYSNLSANPHPTSTSAHPAPPTSHPLAGGAHPQAPSPPGPTHPSATGHAGTAPQHPTSSATGPSYPQAGPAPAHPSTSPGQASLNAPTPTPGSAHPSGGPGHAPTGPAHPTSPHPQSSSAQPSPGSPHQSTSPAARPDTASAQPQRSASTAPPTRTTDPPGPTTPAAPRSATDAGPASRPTAGEPPSDGPRPRTTASDTPPRPSQTIPTSHPDAGNGPAARPDADSVPGRAADHVTTQRIPGLPKPGETAAQPTPKTATAAASRSGGTSPAPGSPSQTGPGGQPHGGDEPTTLGVGDANPFQYPVATPDNVGRPYYDGASSTTVDRSDLATTIERWGVGETDTIAVGRTDIPGLEGVTFEGGSPTVRDAAGLPKWADDPVLNSSEIKAPDTFLSYNRNHAENDILANVDHEISVHEIPRDVEATVTVEQSNPAGACPSCKSGLGNNPRAAAGPIKLFSEKYPNITIVIKSPGAVPDYVVRGGMRLEP